MMAVVEQETEARPVRTILREFVRSVIEGEDEIVSDQVLEYAQRRFEGDEEFRLSAARDALAVMVPEVLSREIRLRRDDFVQTATGAKRRTKVEETIRERLSHVFEANGAGKYSGFLRLRKHELLTLNERDEKTIATTQKWVIARADLASRMDDIRTVDDTFKSVELNAWWQRHFAEQAD